MYDATDTQGTTQQVLHHCPHCKGRFEVHTETAAREVFCPLCGRGFDPVTVDTIQYAAGTPVALSPSPSTVATPNQEERLRPGTLLGQYRVEDLIGRGGMGAVYRATQTSLDRTVALKVLPRHMAEDPEFVERFRREAKALAELNHPNIVAIHDRGEAEGHCYFAMELVDGVSLRQLIQSKRTTPQESLALVPQLCEALEYAHGRGVIHRDIKPENILIDRSGRVKIADFGLARIVRGDGPQASGLTRSDVLMGTVDYMAPEQRESPKDVDHRVDIFSLGVVVYELLTGELPIGRFDPPSKRASIDARIDEVVMKLLEKDREARFQSASDLRARIVEILASPQRPLAEPAREARTPSIASPARGENFVAAFLSVFGGIAAVSSALCALSLPQRAHNATATIVWLVVGVLFLTAGVLGDLRPGAEADASRQRRRTWLAVGFLVWGLLTWVLAISPSVLRMPDPFLRAQVARTYFFAVAIPLVLATFLIFARFRPRGGGVLPYGAGGAVLVLAIGCGLYARGVNLSSEQAELWGAMTRYFPVAPVAVLALGWAGSLRAFNR